MKKYFFIVFIFLSFITQTIAEPGANPIFSRLTISDGFGFLGLLFGINSLYQGFIHATNYSKIYQASFFLILTFFLPILFSYNINQTLVECLILLFLVLVSIGMYDTFKDKLETVLFPLIIYTLITASILGFYDLLASNIGLPRIFPERNDGEAVSGFRNAGQAGAYYLVLLSVVIPLKFSKLSKSLSKLNLRLLDISLILSLVFIFFTGKIAAYIGLLFGVFFFLIYRRNFKAVIGVAFAGLMLLLVWNNLDSIAPDTYNRIGSKYRTRVVNTIENSDDESFIKRNIGNAIIAFEDRPLIGTGIGAFSGVYERHEVHSTYFKILGETGVLGLIGYGLFFLSFIMFFRLRKYKAFNPYSDYLAIMYPFILGCFISWAYTYHLRKREFWILLTIVLICAYKATEYNKRLRAEN